MRSTQQNLANSREELVSIEQEFTRLQKRIEAVRDSVATTIVRLFGEQRPGFAGLDEEALIERVASSVVARLPTPPKSQAQGEKRFVREKEAAAFLGISVSALRSWRSKRRHQSGTPVTHMGRMAVFSVKDLARFAEERTVGRR